MAEEMNPECWVLFSEEDADLSWYRWFNQRNYAIGKLGWAHRVVLARVLGRELVNGEEVDHINFTRNDNRRENIRLTSTRQNRQRVQARANANNGGYRGVTFHKASQKWMSHVHHQGATHYLGLYSTAAEAGAAAHAKRIELGFFGEPQFEGAVPQRPLPEKNTTGFPYVFKTKWNKWEAKFRHKRQWFRLGAFDDPRSAYDAVVAKRNELGIDTPYRPRQEAA